MQITDHGRTVLRRAAVDVDDVEETFLPVLTATERAELLSTMKKCLPINRAAPGANIDGIQRTIAIERGRPSAQSNNSSEPAGFRPISTWTTTDGR